MSVRIETLEKIMRKINNAYHDRDDYPPYKLDVFTDRAVYHQYMEKLIEEEVNLEKGGK